MKKTAESPKKILSRAELRAKLVRPPPEEVYIEKLGGLVRVCPPDFDRVMSLKAQGASEGQIGLELFLMSCVDLTPEDVEEIRQNNHGINVAALVNRISAMVNPLTEEALGKQ